MNPTGGSGGTGFVTIISRPLDKLSGLDYQRQSIENVPRSDET